MEAREHTTDWREVARRRQGAYDQYQNPASFCTASWPGSAPSGAEAPQLRLGQGHSSTPLIHHFSGLGGASPGDRVVEEAQARGPAAAHQSVDKAADGTDLPASQPYGHHHDLATDGEGDGYHAGPGRSPLSQVRGRPGGPPPVRDAQNIYDLPGDSRAQQKEADRGTKMVARSRDLADLVIQSANTRGLEAAATLENLEPREDSDLPGSTSSGFGLPEVRAWCEKHAAVAPLNSRAYGLPYWKRSTWHGELRDPATLPGDRRGGIPRSQHLIIRSKARSRNSANTRCRSARHTRGRRWTPGSETCPSSGQPGRLLG